ncbi:uncharacterized protein LOC130724849 [Lotus japonicus]|uniref:uncharacterized protein LOC130724849 n=1 Tax=Lotus japonicus TaxID=34305 RepID=UPI0025851698|nr:uncharacterized protein LOC130724849 [Lotus japonicus]
MQNGSLQNSQMMLSAHDIDCWLFPIMLIRNIDQSAGMCNGTRLIVTALTPYIIVATALSGSKTGKPVYIPRLSLTPFDTGLPFKFSRRQFPITVCLAMTINKSQGQ